MVKRGGKSSFFTGLRERRRNRARVDAAARESVRRRVVEQWAAGRAARQARPELHAGPTNFSRGQVPYGVDLAAAWAWRMIVIVAAGLAILWALKFFALVVFPVVIALFIAALVTPVVHALGRLGLPRGLASLIVVIVGLATVGLLLSFVGTQVASGATDLSGQVLRGLDEIRRWLHEGPLHASQTQIDQFISNAKSFVDKQGQHLASSATDIGATISDIVASVFITLFSTYFFLADGPRIWAWVVRLFPRGARLRVDASGQVAFRSLVQFVRATVLVAATDAIGTMIGAAILGLPFISAIGVVVFLGAFVPMVGGAVSGTVAVLVALVAKGPITAAIMAGVVVLVQQIEAHVLQPFLMGRFVRVHPLGVIVVIAMGIVVAGIPGALIAVPLAASLNAVMTYLAETNDEANADADAEAPESTADVVTP